MIKVDAIGDACPIPVVKTKKAMSALFAGEELKVLVDNQIALQNVTKMAENEGAKVSSEDLKNGTWSITIEVTEKKVTSGEPEKNTIVVFDSNQMGRGNDALGTVLMKGFIFAITELEALPTTMIFYNGGATLTATGSDSIEDLKSLESQGVEILTCGTCLNYYELTDKLEVGSVTNMYTIVEKMNQADHIIRP